MSNKAWRKNKNEKYVANSVQKCVHDKFGNTIKVSDGRGLKYRLGYSIVRLKIDPSAPRLLSSH